MRFVGDVGRYIRSSIVRQFVLAFVLVQAVLTIAVCGDLVSRSSANLQQNLKQRAEGLAEMLATSSVSWVIAEDGVGLQELVGSAGAFKGLRYAMVLTPSGRVIAHTDAKLIGRQVSDPVAVAVLKGAAQPHVVAKTANAIDVVAPLLSRGRNVGWTWVSLSRAEVNAAVEAAIFKALLYTLAATLVGAAIAFLMARQLANGLRELTDVSNRFRSGERDVRAIHGRGDELGDVGRGVNAMLEAVSTTELSLRDTQRIAKIGSWRTDIDPPALQWSPEVYEIFGFDPAGCEPALEEVVGRLSDEDQVVVADLFAANPLPEAFGFSVRVRSPGQTEKVCWIEGKSEVAEDGRLLGLVGFCQDVTEREEASAQLHQAQKMESVGQLTGGLAHDFNNLLAIVIGNLDMVAEEFPPDAIGKEFAETALQAALKGSELTQQLLAFSRRQPLDPKALDLNELVTAMDTLWQRTLGEDVTVSLNLSPQLWPAKVDRSQLQSSILNLVINARDAMPGGGSLTVETTNVSVDGQNGEIPAGDYALIAVSDTGTGIPPEALARVFEPFFTTKGVGRGSGLGLSMVYGFAKQSGGQLTIYSEVGHGTTVRLYLPRVTGGEAPQIEPAVESSEKKGQGERVLVVEDNLEVRRLAIRQLTELGYYVLEAQDGPEGLQALRDDPSIDLVFTDIVMPGGMTGIQMVDEARRERPALRALFTTGFTSVANANSDRVTGTDLLISKPYRRTDLAAKVREALAA